MFLNNLSLSSLSKALSNSQLTNTSLFKSHIMFRKLMSLKRMIFQCKTPTQAKRENITVPAWQPGQGTDMRKPTSFETKATMKICLDEIHSNLDKLYLKHMTNQD